MLFVDSHPEKHHLTGNLMDTELDIAAQHLELLKRMLFGNHPRAERSFRSQAGPMVYICAVQKLDPWAIYNTIADSSHIESHIINSQYLRALYVEFYGNWMLFYSPAASQINLGIDTFNQSLDSAAIQELTSFGKKNNIKNLKELHFDVFIAMYETYYGLLKHIFLLDDRQLNRIKLINTYKKFYSNYLELQAGERIDTSTHVGFFSWIYYFEVQAVRFLIQESKDIEIHDVATNTGNLPLLLSQLASNSLLPFEAKAICCSDYNEIVPLEIFSSLQEALGRFHYQINVEKIDLWAPKSTLMNADVIIANDVLEHFTEPDSETIFYNLWMNTKNILIIHVPIEEIPNRFYGHFTSFTNERLFSWAEKLPDCENFTPQVMHHICPDVDYDKSGFLFLKRKSRPNISIRT